MLHALSKIIDNNKIIIVNGLNSPFQRLCARDAAELNVMAYAK